MIDLPVVFNLTPRQRETLLEVEKERSVADTVWHYADGGPLTELSYEQWEKEVQDVVSLLTQKRNPVIIMAHTHWYVMQCLLQMAYDDDDEDYDALVRRNLKALCESKFEEKS